MPAELVFVARFPVIEVNPTIAVLVVAIACPTNEMAADTSKCIEVTSSRKITNSKGDNTAGDSSIGVASCT